MEIIKVIHMIENKMFKYYVLEQKITQNNNNKYIAAFNVLVIHCACCSIV